MARNAPDPIPTSLKRKIEEIYERADALPDESPEGVIVCPPGVRPKHVHVMVAILEAPSVQLRLPRHGQPAPTATLHAINAYPGGGTYLWQPVAHTPGGVVTHGAANLATHDVTAVARGSMEVEVVYTVPEGIASARCRIDVVAPVVRAGDELDFGRVPRVHPATPSADREVRVANVGDADLTLDGLALAGDHAGDFEITSRPDDGTVVGARQDVAVRIRLSPTASGLRSARLVIASDDPASPQVAVALRGRGTAPRIVLEPVEAFGETRLGVVGEKTLTIRNADDADADLVLTGFRAGSEVFGVDASATRRTLAAGQSTTLRVGHRPSAEGEQRSVVEVDSNDPATPTASTPIVGIGIRPRLEVSPLEGFGGVTVGKRRPEPQRLTLTNRGRAPLTVGPFALAGEHAEDFTPADDVLVQRTLGPDESCVLELPFTPRARGERAATIRFSSNDPDQPEVAVPLAGRGLRPKLEIVRVDPIADVLFGVLGRTTVTVTNAGDEGSELDVREVGLRERDHAHFGVERTLVGQTLAKGETKTFQIVFSDSCAVKTAPAA